MTQINLLRQVKNLNFPEWFLINWQIVRSVSSWNLTVALKTLAWADPSTTDPVFVRIGGVVRTITSACTITIESNDFYHFNAWSSELATKEIDYFVYLSEFWWPAITRVPYATSFADWDVWEKQIANTWWFIPTNKLVNIWRFNAIKASWTTWVWSLPATSVIINRPIYETRWLDCIATLSGLTWSAWSYAEVGASAKYKISENTINFIFWKKVTNIWSWSWDSLLKTPFGGSNSSDLILWSWWIMNWNNWTFKTIICPYGDSCEYLNFSNNLGVNWGQYSAIIVNDFIMWNVTYQI